MVHNLMHALQPNGSDASSLFNRINLQLFHCGVSVMFSFKVLHSWVISGVSYLSRAQEEEALRCLNSAYEDELSEQWRNLKDACNIPLVSMGDVLFAKRMKNRISEWHDGLLRDSNEGSQFQGSSSDSKQHLQTIFFNMRPALTLNGFTSHQLRLIQMVLFSSFKYALLH